MGFDADWLNLRAPADDRARDAGLLARAIAYADAGGYVLDLGCGTGATTRAFAAAGARGLGWRLLDNDPALLSVAQQNHPQAEICLSDLREIDALPLKDVRLVTASALFDLVSEVWAARLVDRLARHGIALYAALIYDGVMRWSPEDPLDAEVTRHFNRHQLGDKGFGQAMGPQAGASMTALLRARRFSVDCAPSPWCLGPRDALLQQELLSGIAGAAQEVGLDGAGDWAARRRAALDHGRAEIGHTDLLALPGDK